MLFAETGSLEGKFGPYTGRRFLIVRGPGPRTVVRQHNFLYPGTVGNPVRLLFRPRAVTLYDDFVW